jgi:hypothetical protein
MVGVTTSTEAEKFVIASVSEILEGDGSSKYSISNIAIQNVFDLGLPMPPYTLDRRQPFSKIIVESDHRKDNREDNDNSENNWIAKMTSRSNMDVTGV